MNGKKDNFDMVFTGVLAGLIFVMSLVPFLGFIPLGFMNATIIQIPVIIGAVLLGYKRGAFLGLLFGFLSMWKNTTAPNLTSFVFSPLVPMPLLSEEQTAAVFFIRIVKCAFICLFSRMMIGIVSCALNRCLSKRQRIPQHVRYMLCGFFGSLTNTVFVMGGIYFLYGEAYASATGAKSVSLLAKVIAGIVFMQGVPEAIISAVIAAALLKVLVKIKKDV